MRRQILPSDRGSNSRGFTLVELLVVIAIIGTLVALLLPAVQSARESARGNTCRNNIKQLHLAMTQYDGSFRKLPGYVNEVRNPNGAADEGRRASWIVMLFPYMEQAPLWDQWSKVLPGSADYNVNNWNQIPNDAGNAPQIEIFECPSDAPEGPGSPWLSYVVNAGQAMDCSTRGETGTVVGDIVVNTEYLANGVFFDNAKNVAILPSAAVADGRENHQSLSSSIDYVQANDGTSNTMMISENINAVYWAYDGSSAMAALDESDVVDQKQNFGFVWHNNVTVDSDLRRINGSNNELPPAGMIELSQEEVYGYPSSNHPGGVNIAYVDGHIVFVPDSINRLVYAQSMTSNRKRSKLYEGDPTTGVPDRKLPQPSDADF